MGGSKNNKEVGKKKYCPVSRNTLVQMYIMVGREAYRPTQHSAFSGWFVIRPEFEFGVYFISIYPRFEIQET